MTVNDEADRTRTQTLIFEVDLAHPPAKVWRALTQPELMAQWLLPVFDFAAERGVAFEFRTEAQPGWDGVVNCTVLDVDEPRMIRYTWTVPFLETVVTFTLTPTTAGTRLRIVQSGFDENQKREFGGARYGWKMMSGRLVDLLDALP